MQTGGSTQETFFRRQGHFFEHGFEPSFFPCDSVFFDTFSPHRHGLSLTPVNTPSGLAQLLSHLQTAMQGTLAFTHLHRFFVHNVPELPCPTPQVHPCLSVVASGNNKSGFIYRTILFKIVHSNNYYLIVVHTSNYNYNCTFK